MSDLPVLREPMGDWVNRGACREAVIRGEAEPSWWFPGTDREMRTINIAKRICDGCLVKAECLDWAVHHEQYGIWGGVGPRQREYVVSGRRIVCRHCGKSFAASTSGRVYCTDACYRAEKLKRKREARLGTITERQVPSLVGYEKVCTVCRTMFMGRNNSSVYCTPRCKNAARRSVRRARRENNNG